MDAVLNEPITIDDIIVAEIIKEDRESRDKHEHEVSLWIKEKDIIRPSTNITILSHIEPGVYTADFSRDYGYYCRKLDYVSDELFVFTDSITEELIKEINLFWDKSDKYKEQNLIHKRGILLEGFPGTGKSSIITLLSNEIIKQGGVVFKITNFRNLDDYVNFLRIGFRQIQPDTPIITILEDVDQYDDVVDELLDFLDGKTHINHHVVIGTTNNTERIPDNFLRPSRFDLRIEIPLPNDKTREEFFKFKNVPEIDLKELVEKSSKCSIADLKEIYTCVYLLDYTIEDAIKKVTNPREKKNYLLNPLKTSKIGL